MGDTALIGDLVIIPQDEVEKVEEPEEKVTRQSALYEKEKFPLTVIKPNLVTVCDSGINSDGEPNCMTIDKGPYQWKSRKFELKYDRRYWERWQRTLNLKKEAYASCFAFTGKYDLTQTEKNNPFFRTSIQLEQTIDKRRRITPTHAYIHIRGIEEEGEADLKITFYRGQKTFNECTWDDTFIEHEPLATPSLEIITKNQEADIETTLENVQILHNADDMNIRDMTYNFVVQVDKKIDEYGNRETIGCCQLRSSTQGRAIKRYNTYSGPAGMKPTESLNPYVKRDYKIKTWLR